MDPEQPKVGFTHASIVNVSPIEDVGLLDAYVAPLSERTVSVSVVAGGVNTVTVAAKVVPVS